MKQLVLIPSTNYGSGESYFHELLIVVGLACTSGLAIKVPALFGLELSGDGEMFYLRNLSLFMLPLLAGYLAWKRRLLPICLTWLVPSFVGAAVFANIYPFSSESATEILTAIHLPIALWLLVGYTYVGGKWRSTTKRMDFVRFSGELSIYYLLIALGGGVLTALTIQMFAFIDLDIVWMAEEWLLPCGAVGAIIVGAWLVEAKQGSIGNIVPVLTYVFTPLFTLVLLVFLATMVWTGRGIDIEREVLILFNLLLILVLGLVLYNVSARNLENPPNAFDALQLVLVVGALVVDATVLIAIAGRISEFGFSANKTAALGENLIVLVNLTWSAWLYFRFLRHQSSFVTLERWHTAYLPVYAVWALIVIVGFPPAFAYL